ncbi:hypothetical protein C8R45DRAFT_923365 [Mycena sanguinolenta]|nr:hypothetical protein C8R45DRAFT_923365 [Mycena sanguinolenta]
MRPPRLSGNGRETLSQFDAPSFNSVLDGGEGLNASWAWEIAGNVPITRSRMLTFTIMLLNQHKLNYFKNTPVPGHPWVPGYLMKEFDSRCEDFLFYAVLVEKGKLQPARLSGRSGSDYHPPQGNSLAMGLGLDIELLGHIPHRYKHLLPSFSFSFPYNIDSYHSPGPALTLAMRLDPAAATTAYVARWPATVFADVSGMRRKKNSR